MKRAHPDEEIIKKASEKEKSPEQIQDNKIDIAVDLDDEEGASHTYVVTFTKGENAQEWIPSEVSELSSL